jgi:hypothetical protein
MFSRAALLFTLLSTVALFGAEEGFKSLFNGKDLTGWDGNTELWSVADGAIKGETTTEKKAKGNTFLVWRDGKTTDFHLKCKFKLEGSNNSGVQYRSVENPKWVMIGYQCDLQYGAENMCKLYHEKNPRGRVCMAGEVVVMEPSADPKKPTAGKKVTGPTPDAEKLKTITKKGDWNECEVIAKGNHVIHKINGVVAVDFTDNDEKNRCMEGLLALQIHAGAPMTIYFKDIEFKELKN